MKDSGLVFLKNFSELSISGEGSKDFLQGQISADIDKIDENNSSLACLCNVKGRVISSFTLIKDTSGKNRFSLVGPKETIQRTERELRKYIPFYKSEMKIRNESNLFGCKEEISEILFGDLNFSENNTVSFQNEKLIRFLNKSFILIYASSELSDTLRAISNEDPYEWILDDISNKNVEIDENTSELYLPHDLNYHENGRIDFEKGCYTGQEIIARMQYRSKNLPRLYLLNSMKEVKTNMVVTKKNSEKKIGSVVSSVKNSNGSSFLVSISKNLEEKEISIRELDINLSIN